MRYFSMFSGIGGFELGIVQAYELQKVGIESKDCADAPSVGAQHGKRPLCVGYSEIDKYAIQIYESQFPDHRNFGDATKIDPAELPDFDLLVGGFPCQAFSIAGKRGGFDDTRGTLFFDIARILKEKRPRNFVLENVKGLLSHNDGRTFKTIISTLAELGYCVEWQVLNSKNFGVPQNRERVFIVGHFGGIPERKVFPIGENNPKGLVELTTNADEASRVYDSAGISRTIKNGGGMGAKTGLYAKTVRSGGRSSPHGSKQNWDSYEMEGRIRRLTPTECARLQGFPDNWHEGVSDTQAYKCYGNAVTVNVVEAVVSAILPPYGTTHGQKT